jgi:hypothetical protein
MNIRTIPLRLTQGRCDDFTLVALLAGGFPLAFWASNQLYRGVAGGSFAPWPAPL